MSKTIRYAAFLLPTDATTSLAEALISGIGPEYIANGASAEEAMSALEAKFKAADPENNEAHWDEMFAPAGAHMSSPMYQVHVVYIAA